MSTTSEGYRPRPGADSAAAGAMPPDRAVDPVLTVPTVSTVIGFALLLLAILAFRGLIGFDPARGPASTGSRVEDILFEPTATSPLLVFSGAAWLLARRLGRIRSRCGGPASLWLAIPAIAAGSTLCLWSYHVAQPALLLPSLSLVSFGAAAWLGGVPLFKAVALPALFLLFAFPLPTPLVNQWIYSLQLATASTVGAAFDALGFTTRVSGDLLYRDQKIFQVIESCSGVRGVATLFMTSFLYHDLFYRSRLQSLLIVLGSIPIALFVNHLRVATIMLNPYSSFAAVHTAQGLVMIVFGVLLLAGWDAILSRILPNFESVRRRSARAPLPGFRLALLASLAGLLAAGSFVVRPWQTPSVPNPPLSSFPAKMDGWSPQSLKLDRDFLGSVNFSEWVNRRYTRGRDHVEVLLGADFHVDPRVDFSSPKVAIPGAGYVVTARGESKLGNGQIVERVETMGPQGRMISYVWHYGDRPTGREILWSALALDRSALRRSDRSVVARVMTPIVGAVEDEEQLLLEFSAKVDRELVRILGRSGT